MDGFPLLPLPPLSWTNYVGFERMEVRCEFTELMPSIVHPMIHLVFKIGYRQEAKYNAFFLLPFTVLQIRQAQSGVIYPKLMSPNLDLITVSAFP